MSAHAIPGWLSPHYPFTPRRFATPGGAGMSYLDEGAGTDNAVLLLHGNPTWSFYYRRLVRHLSPGLRCIAPDHVGMGLSDKPLDYDYRLATRVADIEALVDSLGLRRLHLVVHDWGGAIGMGLAVRRPDLIGRIVILNTAAFPSPWIPARIALCRAPGIGEWIVRGLNGFARPATRMAMHARALTREERRAYLFPYDSWDHRIAVHRFVRDIPMETGHPSRAKLEEIAGGLSRLAPHPKLILWGGKDFCFDDRFLARWRGIYPDAAWHRFPDAGHYVLEDAGDEIYRRIADFLG
jgi:haloalkane dehalogenase